VATVWDAAPFSKALPYVLFAATAAAVGFLAWRLGGKVAAFLALALTLTSFGFFHTMGGGIPRSFAFPVVAGALVALATGRIRGSAACVLAGAAFYPPAGVLAGATLFGVLLLLPAEDRGPARDWSLGRRLGLLAVTAGLGLLVVAPALIGSREFGPRIVQTGGEPFPEAGPGGRYVDRNRPPWPGALEAVPPVARDALSGRGRPLVPPVRDFLLGPEGGPTPPRAAFFWGLLAAVCLLGWVPLLRRERTARVLAVFGAAALACHGIARIGAPWLYLPPRYLMYSVPVLCVVGVPAGLVSACRQLDRGRASPWIAALACGLLLAAIGTRGDPRSGIRFSARPFAPTLSAIAALPKDALVAGWPQGLMDYVPYFARRQALLTYETHQAFHEGYVLEMRRRMDALIRAWFAVDPAPVVALREEFGVTHLVVDRRHFESKPPLYFRPFTRPVARAWRRGHGRFWLAHAVPESAIVARDGSVVVVDLAKIDAP
jgi:hypothetical protein